MQLETYLSADRAELVQIDEVGEFLSVAESAAGRPHRILKVNAGEGGFDLRLEGMIEQL